MKKFFYLIPVFLWIQACSQSTPGANAGQAANGHSILTDTTGNSLGNSPDGAYRLFKFKRQAGDKSVVDLNLLRLKDLKEFSLTTITLDSSNINPKFYWSKEGKYLVTDRSIPDSAGKAEVVLFDLQNGVEDQTNPGRLFGFDAMNQVVFYHRAAEDRQNICFYYLNNPQFEKSRGIMAPAVGKLPEISFSYKEKKAKVKAFTTDNTPVNIPLQY